MLDEADSKTVLIALEEYREQMKSWKQTSEVIERTAAISLLIKKLRQGSG